MKKLRVIELGNKVLRQKSKKVSRAEILSQKFQNFCDELIQTCKEKNGVGIAAPQVGVSKRVCIVWSRPNKRYKKIPKMEPEVIINPVFVAQSKQMKKEFEGCLSIPGIRGLVPRSVKISIEYTNRKGEKRRSQYKDFVARIFQHEIDHLNGIVFLDRTNSKDLVTESEYQKIIKRKK